MNGVVRLLWRPDSPRTSTQLPAATVETVEGAEGPRWLLSKAAPESSSSVGQGVDHHQPRTPVAAVGVDVGPPCPRGCASSTEDRDNLGGAYSCESWHKSWGGGREVGTLAVKTVWGMQGGQMTLDILPKLNSSALVFVVEGTTR